MKKCDCYYEKPYKRPVYGKYTGRIEYYEEQMIGYCYGTKECEQCDCNGDKSKCTFYAEVRESDKIDNTKISDAEELKLLRQFIKEHDMVWEFEDWVNKTTKE